MREQTTPPPKKAVILILISLARKAENRSGKELETEIRKVLVDGLAELPWVVVEQVILVKE